MGWRSWVSVVGSSEHQRRPHGGRCLAVWWQRLAGWCWERGLLCGVLCWGRRRLQAPACELEAVHHLRQFLLRPFVTCCLLPSLLADCRILPSLRAGYRLSAEEIERLLDQLDPGNTGGWVGASAGIGAGTATALDLGL